MIAPFFYYFFYFGALGALLPYLGPYLIGLQLSLIEIGWISGIMTLTKVFSPWIWSWLADRSAHVSHLGKLALLSSLLMFSLWVMSERFWPLLVLMALFSFFWHAGLPIYEAIVLQRLQGRTQHYSWLRTGGSLGFIVAVLGVGELNNNGSQWGIWFTFLMLVGMAWSAWTLNPEPGENLAPEIANETDHTGCYPQRLSQLMRLPVVWVFLCLVFLLQFSHGTFYGFLTLHWQNMGLSDRHIAQLWALGVLAEIVAFALMPWVLRHLTMNWLWLIIALATMWRWGINMQTAGDSGWWWLSQGLHGITFGVFHATAIFLIHRLFTGAVRYQGQGIYASLGHGSGVALGIMLAGVLWQLGGAPLAFAASLAVAGMALLLTIVYWRSFPTKTNSPH